VATGPGGPAGDGPKLNGPFVPLAVGAYVIACATKGGPYEGAAMNPARAFGPDVALGNLSTWWIYLLGPAIGALVAVGVAYVMRGPAGAGEATAAEGTPLHRGTADPETPAPTARGPE
jgi:aquaporin Z